MQIFECNFKIYSNYRDEDNYPTWRCEYCTYSNECLDKLYDELLKVKIEKECGTSEDYNYVEVEFECIRKIEILDSFNVNFQTFKEIKAINNKENLLEFLLSDSENARLLAEYRLKELEELNGNN